MAFSFSPKIVTDGLVLALDAANTKSYVSGSTVWNDLTANRNNGTLTNGPTFSSANGGSIVFDGTNDYIIVPISSNSTKNLYFSGSSNITVSSWVKTNSLTLNRQDYLMLEDEPNLDILEPIRLFISGSSVTFQVVNASSSFVNTTKNNALPTTASYYNIVGTYDGSNVKLYIQGILEAQDSLSLNIKNSQAGINARWIIGRGEIPLTSRIFNGNIAIIYIYNRTLSAQEILQNYNATKGRFGLT